MKKRTVLFIVVALLLAFALIIGGIAAYFTDTETATNTFTIGNVNITLTEPHWSTTDTTPQNGVPDAAENLVPGDSVAKDPTVTVDAGSNDAFIFVKVQIPNYNNSSSAPTDLFSVYRITDSTTTPPTTAAGVDTSKWNLVSQTTANNVHTYVYAYATGTSKADLVAVPAETSVKLFDGVTLSTDNTVVEAASNATGNENIIINAYAIQTENVTETTQAAIYALFPQN